MAGRRFEFRRTYLNLEERSSATKDPSNSNGVFFGLSIPYGIGF